MKKLFILALILVGIASCQKEVIKPNSGNSVSYQKSSISTNDGADSTNDNSTVDDENSVNTNEGDITDPYRKRDKN